MGGGGGGGGGLKREISFSISRMGFRKGKKKRRKISRKRGRGGMVAFWGFPSIPGEKRPELLRENGETALYLGDDPIGRKSLRKQGILSQKRRMSLNGGCSFCE